MDRASCNIDLEGLIRLMINLDKYISIKTNTVRRECHALQKLLHPVKVEQTEPKQCSVDSSSTKTQSSALIDPPSLHSSESPLDNETLLNMSSIDKLLAKVKNVRTSVIDQEIREVCHIQETSTQKIKSVKSTVHPSKTNQESANPKHELTSHVTRLPANKSKPTFHKTSYQSSYKKHQTAASTTRSRLKPVPGTTVSASKSTRQRLVTKRSQTSNPSEGGTVLSHPNEAGDHQDKAQHKHCLSDNSNHLPFVNNTNINQHNADCSTQPESVLFSLREHGQSLLVPKSLGVKVRKNDSLHQKIADKKQSRTLNKLPSKIRDYYLTCEEILP